MLPMHKLIASCECRQHRQSLKTSADSIEASKIGSGFTLDIPILFQSH
jgi:hypothetical protein